MSSLLNSIFDSKSIFIVFEDKFLIEFGVNSISNFSGF